MKAHNLYLSITVCNYFVFTFSIDKIQSHKTLILLAPKHLISKLILFVQFNSMFSKLIFFINFGCFFLLYGATPQWQSVLLLCIIILQISGLWWGTIVTISGLWCSTIVTISGLWCSTTVVISGLPLCSGRHLQFYNHKSLAWRQWNLKQDFAQSSYKGSEYL